MESYATFDDVFVLGVEYSELDSSSPYSRVPKLGQNAEQWGRISTKKEIASLRQDRSISSYPGVLRQFKTTFNVPTLDQLSRAEKMYILYSFGYNCVETRGQNPISIIKLVETVIGRCKFFDALKCRFARRAISRKTHAAIAKQKHEEDQVEWFDCKGREKAYLRKYRYGCLDHHWFVRHQQKSVGMVIDNHFSPSCYDEDVVVPPVIRPRWNRESFSSDLAQSKSDSELLLRKESPPVRSVMLLTKLRAYIRFLRVSPMRVWNRSVVNEKQNTKWESALPQMDGMAGEELGQVQTGNVVLTESNPASTSVAAEKKFSFGWHKLCSSESTTDYRYLLDRWTLYKTDTWRSSQKTNFEFDRIKCDLPYDFVNARNDGTMPIAVPFKIFRYYKSDIEIKIHVNSNKFQVGQLQMSWQYMEKFDGNKLTNVYSRCQLPHVLVNAGSSNEATLIVPYKYIYPYLATSQRKNAPDCLYLGTLRLFVLSPLSVPDGGPDQCGISLFVRFPNAEFTGMTDGSVSLPQMEGAAAAMVAGAVFNKFIGDKNCDNPSNNVNPQYLVPTASHSWSAGTGLSEQVHSLRLDNTTVGVGRVGIDDSETSIGIPCRTFGMLKHFKWSQTDAAKNVAGSLLWSCDVNAQIEKSMCYSEKTDSILTKYSVPPVSVVASMYKQWRGSLEFRFDIIASQFHTGRLLCAYLPGFYGDASNITIWQARNSPCIEFSLQDATSFTFNVPYISDRPWWQRRYTGPHKYRETASPSKIVLFVLNPLVPMENVVPEVSIIPYVRAGIDFEVSVPVQPALGLSDEIRTSIGQQDLIFPTTGSYPMRATNYEGFGDDKKYIFYEGTAAFGTASTFHAPERKLKDKEYYYGKFKNPKKVGVMKVTEGGGDYQRDIGYIVLWPTPSGNYGVPFPSSDLGKAAADLVAKQLRQGKPRDEILKSCYDYKVDGSTSSSTWADLIAEPVYGTIAAESEFEFVGEPEMDDRITAPNLMAPTSSLASTSSGNLTFNEKFDDLKDLARRYQLYAEGDIKLKAGYNTGDALAVFPAIPHGLALDVDKPSSLFNVCRDGHIPLISSGYIYFRGSLRFRLVFSSDSITLGGAKIWVQHHPDGDCKDNRLQTYPNIEETDGFKSHTYSFYIQNASVNSIIEFEVPFYQDSMYGLTRKPNSSTSSDICQLFSLGNIVVGMYAGVLDKNVDMSMRVYYSISDDFSFNVFRGFPMCVYTDEVWPPAVKSIPVKKKKIIQISAEPQMEDACEGDPEMFAKIKDWTINKVPTPRSIVNDIASDLSEHIKTALNSFSQKVDAAKKQTIKECIKQVSGPAIATAIGNLLHIIVNPTPVTIAIAVGNILVAILGVTFLCLTKFVSVFTNMLTSVWGKLTGSSDIVASPESDKLQEDANKVLGGIVLSAVCTMLGVTLAGPKTFPDVLRNLSTGVALTNNMIRLVQNSGDLIVWCIRWVTGQLYPDLALKAKLYDAAPTIKQWYMECTYLLDCRNKETYLYDKSMMDRVFHACVVGSLLVSSGIDHSVPGGRVICDTQKEMVKLRNNLFERGVHPDVRFETFPLWISGAPGIGKSFLIPKLVNDLLKSVNFSQSGSLIYTIPSGAKYWSGVQNPAALVSDDIFQVNGTKKEEEIANLFMICSSSVLNPPMAAVEDKERRINPLLYIMLCNHHFPNLSPTCNTPEAVYRRRKFLIYAELRDDLREQYPNFRDASELPPEEVKGLGHMKFQIAHNVKDPETTYSEWMNYDQLFDLIKVKFRSHYLAEQANFKQRMIDMYCLDPNFNETNIIMSMPGLEEQPSLEAQIEFYKKEINSKLDRLEDPRHKDPVAQRWIKKFLDRVGLKPGEAQMEAGTSAAVTAEDVDQMVVNAVEAVDAEENKSAGKRAESNCAEELSAIHAKIQKVHKQNLNQTHVFRDLVAFSPDISPDLETIPFIYIHAFRQGNFFHFENNINQLFLNFFFHDFLQCNPMDNTWYSQAVADMLETANYNIHEKLQFLSHMRGGIDWIFKTVTGYDQRIEAAKPTIGVSHRLCPTKSVLYPHSMPKEKRPLQGALKRLNLVESCRINELWCYAIRERLVYLFSVENPILYDLISDAKNQQCYNIRSPFFGLLSPNTDNYAANFEMGLRNTICNNFLSSDQKVILVKWFMELYSLRVFGLAFAVNCECDSARMYKQCGEGIIDGVVKFCNIKGKLEGGSINYKPCINTSCAYNNDVIYYLHCLAAFSCSGYYTVCPSAVSVQDRIKAGQKIPLVVGDIKFIERNPLQKILRKRGEKNIMSSISNMCNWFKHLLYHTIPTGLSRVVSFLLHHMPKLMAAALAFSVIAAPIVVGRGIYKIFSPDTPISVRAEAESNYFKFEQPKIVQKKLMNAAPKAFAAAQMSGASRVSLAKRIEDNTVLLYATWTEDGTRQARSCRNIMLRGRSMLVLRHYLEEYSHLVEQQLKVGDIVEFFLFFNKTGKLCKVPITWPHLQNVAWCSSSPDKITSNFGIVLLPVFVPQFKDIVKCFATLSEHNNTSSVCDLYVVNGESSFNIPVNKVNNFTVLGTTTSSAVVCNTVYKYNKQYKGMCGSLLVSPNLGSGNGAIVGVHIAGDSKSGMGFAEPIYKNEFLAFFQEYPDTIVPDIELDETIRPSVELNSNLLMYGCVSETFAHKESGKSKIVPSKIHGEVFPVRTEVNPLRPNDPRQPPGSHPLRDGCEKHGSGDVKLFDPALVEEVTEHLKDQLPQIVRPIRSEVKPLTLQQAICGDVDVPYFESLNWKSSEGFPLSAYRPSFAHDKRWLFDMTLTEHGYKLNKIHPRLQTQLELRQACFEQNIKPPTVYVDCLKDYRLTPEKCRQPGKTRIFSIAPVQCSIDIRTYLNDFCASIKKSRISNSIGIGINPDSLEWTNLVNYLFEVGTKIVTLDYSNYGPSLMSQLVVAGNEVIAEWHRYHGASEEHVKRVEWLLANDIVNPVHLCANVLYQTVNGIASGSPLTGECNSIPNIFYIRLTYLEIMKKHLPHLANMTSFDEHVRLVVYGDDLIMSVSDTICEIFNSISIRDHLILHGIKVTSAQKSAEMVPYTDIYQATFLKRSFKEHPTRPGVWLAPIETQSIEECVNWVHISDDPNEALLECIRSSLDLAYSHGPNYYKNHYSLLKKKITDLGLRINVKPWSQRDEEIFGEGGEKFFDKIKLSLPWYYELSDMTL